MMEGLEQASLKDLTVKTSNIVSWLKLNSVPTAVQVDPSNKLGLKDAFRIHEGVYFDPIPPDVIQKAKEEVAKATNYTTQNIPLLQDERIGGKVMRSAEPRITVGSTLVPIFKEQVEATAQFLARLGFEPPPPRASSGETFVIVDENPSNVHVYKTADPKISVVVTRKGTKDTDQAIRVELSIQS